METIITRFPPSPTGYLHLGGARTAIFNWLYARRMRGKFILRIEDTDIKRSTKESVDAIFNALDWLGIDWDEGPFYQTERFDVYETYIQKLIETGHAYYCACSPEEVEAMRKKSMAAGGNPKYDGTCREKGLKKGPNMVARFKASYIGSTIIEDLVKGTVSVPNSELDDFVIQRSDGVPTYNFAVVIDDMTMQVNTIIRGDDHLSNTPKQIQLYKAFERPLPKFAHVPMVLGSDRTRLSKRHGAMSVTAYRDMGYLPDAMINFLVRLGWSHGDQEVFTREELLEKFDLEHVGKSAGVFNPEKLMSINAEHIKNMQPEKLAGHLQPFLDQQGYDTASGPDVTGIIKTLNLRSKTLEEMAAAAAFYYKKDVEYDEKAAQKFLKGNILEPLEALVQAFSVLEPFNEKEIENTFTLVMENAGIKLGKIAQPVRVALTGGTVSPGITEIIEVLGKERVIPRLKKAVQFIKNRVAAAD